MKKSASLTFPVVSFRHLETPFHNQGCRDYFAVVDTSQLPDLSDWRRINVRDPKLKGAVPNAIRESLGSKPDMFVFMNRGLVLAVDKVSFDNKASTVTMKLTNPAIHGLLDGGHTYNIVMEETPSLPQKQYLRVEFLEGIDHEGIIDVVDARNTSNQVKDESLMNLSGEFNALKAALKGATYFNQIAFSEYETDDEGNPKPLDVREIVAILTVFDRDHFDDSVHPIDAYRVKAQCLKRFKEHQESYKKIYPLAQEMLALFDHVRYQLPDLYNTVRGVTGDVSGGKFGKLTGVSVYSGKRSQYLYYIGKNSKYGVPDGFTYPILGAFRALLAEKKGRYVWGQGLKPVDLLRGSLGSKLADTIGNFALEAKNPSKTGKSPLVWQACYQSAENAYMRAQLA